MSARCAFFSEEHSSWAIPLTQGVITLVDADIAQALGRHNWYASEMGYAWVAQRVERKLGGGHKTAYMHRVIMKAPDDKCVDHIHHPPKSDLLIDNRRANLRVCTQLENCYNGRKRKGTASKYKGVVWDKREKKWRSAIRVDGKFHSLGYYADEADGARAYDKAAVHHFKEFAMTNEKLGLLKSAI